MKTTQARYEISSEATGVIDFARTMKAAVRVAKRALDQDQSIKPVHIFDRLAHVGKPKVFTVNPCIGEAHRNPYIDHCVVCAPHWGVVVAAAVEQSA